MVQSVGGTAGSVLSGVRWGQTLNEQLKDEPAIRLWIINQKQLQDMGIPPELVTRYLDHPAFTPRHDTILVASLVRLGSASGRDKFLEVALAADDAACPDRAALLCALPQGAAARGRGDQRARLRGSGAKNAFLMFYKLL
jgi:hypothetical protein